MLNRRNFLTTLGTVVAALGLPFKMPAMTGAVTTAAVPTYTGLSIAQIMATAFIPAYAAMKDGHEWADARLNVAMDEGRLIIRPLAASIEVNGIFYDVQQLNVPTCWTKGDEAKNEKQENKERFCASMIENTINAHEDLVCSALNYHNLIVSSGYRVEKGDVNQVVGQNAFYFLTYTAVVGVPKDVDLRTATIVDHSTEVDPIQSCNETGCTLHKIWELETDADSDPAI